MDTDIYLGDNVVTSPKKSELDRFEEFVREFVIEVKSSSRVSIHVPVFHFKILVILCPDQKINTLSCVFTVNQKD
jgi:hypothetical protein